MLRWQKWMNGEQLMYTHMHTCVNTVKNFPPLCQAVKIKCAKIINVKNFLHENFPIYGVSVVMYCVKNCHFWPHFDIETNCTRFCKKLYFVQNLVQWTVTNLHKLMYLKLIHLKQATKFTDHFLSWVLSSVLINKLI